MREVLVPLPGQMFAVEFTLQLHFRLSDDGFLGLAQLCGGSHTGVPTGHRGGQHTAHFKGAESGCYIPRWANVTALPVCLLENWGARHPGPALEKAEFTPRGLVSIQNKSDSWGEGRDHEENTDASPSLAPRGTPQSHDHPAAPHCSGREK